MHQFLNHNGFLNNHQLATSIYQQLLGSNSLSPQLKATTNTIKTAHIGIPSKSFITPPVGYAPLIVLF